MTMRPPRTHAQQLEQPDKTGRFWFQGFSVTGLTVTRVQHRPFEIVLSDGALVPLVPDTNAGYAASVLVGWWTAEQDMGT